jgi:SAM-dependent methyltransferase
MTRKTRGRLNALDWIDPSSDAVLDVGCNVGALLADIACKYRAPNLVGVDVNRDALETGRQRHPTISFVHGDAWNLPFASETFDTVTCLEVIEHLEAERRADAFHEMRRVTRPGGRLIVSTPHNGWFSWLDANNARFRSPALYRRLIGAGVKDASYRREKRPIVWHEHFRPEQLIALASPGWRPTALIRGGLVVAPLVDWLRWPFYRTGRGTHRLSLLLERLAAWDTSHDYGRASWRMMVVFDAA